MKDSNIIVRIYGIYFDQLKGLLVSDELIKGRNITKFPGGGLEYGEGTIECLQREMLEETGQKFRILSHFYTTDYFVESIFETGQQIISIYYLMEPVEELKILVSKKPFEFLNFIEGAQSFRFISVETIHPDQFTLSIDRHVALLLVERYK